MPRPSAPCTVRLVVSRPLDLAATKAFAAIVGWLKRQRKDPSDLRPSTLSHLLPPEEKMARFPLNTAATALRAIILNAEAPVATRLATVRTVGELETWRERMCMERWQNCQIEYSDLVPET